MERDGVGVLLYAEGRDIWLEIDRRRGGNVYVYLGSELGFGF